MNYFIEIDQQTFLTQVGASVMV